MKTCDFEVTKECLPDLETCEDPIKWNQYLDNLYKNIFVPLYVSSTPIFRGLPVIIRKEPKDGYYEHGFTHLTHADHHHRSEDPNDRVPDFRRSERIRWVKTIIENYDKCKEDGCNKILYWEQLYSNGRIRINLLFEEEAFHIVIEKAQGVYLLITGFYLENDYQIIKRRRKYEQYIKQKTPLV